jgi:DNA-binding GntR family transcriptional regulator
MKKRKKNISNSLIAYEKIKQMILVGEKTANSRLIPADLEQDLGIGRVPIREALIQLGRTGLVVNVPYKGAVVGVPPTIEEIQEIFLLRMELEPKLATRGLEKMNLKQLKEIKKAHKQMCSPNVKDEDYFSLNKHFHFSLYEPSGLHHLCLIADKILQSVESFRMVYTFAAGDFAKFNKDHERILKRIETADGEGLKKELTKNLISGRDTLLEAYRRVSTVLQIR